MGQGREPEGPPGRAGPHPLRGVPRIVWAVIAAQVVAAVAGAIGYLG